MSISGTLLINSNAIAKLGSLTELSVVNCQCLIDRAIPHLKNLKKLTIVSYQEITVRNFLSDLEHLEYVNLRGITRCQVDFKFKRPDKLLHLDLPSFAKDVNIHEMANLYHLTSSIFVKRDIIESLGNLKSLRQPSMILSNVDDVDWFDDHLDILYVNKKEIPKIKYEQLQQLKNINLID